MLLLLCGAAFPARVDCCATDAANRHVVAGADHAGDARSCCGKIAACCHCGGHHAHPGRSAARGMAVHGPVCVCPAPLTIAIDALRPAVISLPRLVPVHVALHSVFAALWRIASGPGVHVDDASPPHIARAAHTAWLRNATLLI